MNIQQRKDGTWEFVDSDWCWLGWIDFSGTDETALDCAVELSRIFPEADEFFCSVRDYRRGNGKGERTIFFGESYDRRLTLTPDPYVPEGHVHAWKRPPKLAIDIGATLS